VAGWQSQPGQLDALHASDPYPSDNDWGIPTLAHAPLYWQPEWLIPYRQRVRTEQSLAEGAVHFFLQDYRFETVWSRPWKALTALRSYRTLLTPDFSLYRDWPPTLQLWNSYRSRWCGCFWRGQGFQVIPTVSWSNAGSYDHCFLGLPRHSLLAVGTVGVDVADPLSRQLFLNGFQEMVRRLAPSRVLCYGRPPEVCHQWVEVVSYPTRWQSIRAAMAGEQGSKGAGEQGSGGAEVKRLNGMTTTEGV